MLSPSSTQLHALFQDEWESRLRENPTFATMAGDHRYNDRLPSCTEEAYARQALTVESFLTRLRGIDRAALGAEDVLNYDFFAREMQIQLDLLRFGAYYIPIVKETGEPAALPNIMLVTPFQSARDYEHYIRRLEGFAGLAGELIALMRAGIARGYAPARWAMAGVVDGYRQHAAAASRDDLSGCVFYQPFNAFPDAVAAPDRQRLADSARAALRQSLAPGYRALADFIEGEYLPQIPEEIATPRMPAPGGGGGADKAADKAADYYAFCVRRFTSLDLTAQEIHQTGLAEVARIRAEMDTVMRSVGFTGSLRAFSDALRADPRFFVDTPEQLMKEVAYLMKRIEGRLPGLFRTLPRTPFGLRETPEYLAPTSTSAYYFLPAGDGTTAGFYYVNTYDLKSRPLYEYEALSLHEAVPGHHLQLALQLELQDIPIFRKWSETTAFVEGWALYAERLGLEMGFYRDPYANFGRLVYEMWRAARLVVDTGLHVFGWSRAQAVEYLAENTALSLLNIANEVDRYIAWPGQALAYKIGELKIRALRQQAETALGARFNVRDFHDVLLRHGGIPLDVLEQNVAAWVAAVSAA